MGDNKHCGNDKGGFPVGNSTGNQMFICLSLSLLVNKLQNKTQRTQLFAEIQTDSGAKQTLKPWNKEGDRKIVIMPPTRVIEFFVKCR